MKIFCPRCHAENETDSAEAGMIHCTCGQWFKESPTSAWEIASKQSSGQRAKFNFGLGLILWPALLAGVLLLATFNLIIWPLALILIFLALAGGAVFQFSRK